MNDHDLVDKIRLSESHEEAFEVFSVWMKEYNNVESNDFLDEVKSIAVRYRDSGQCTMYETVDSILDEINNRERRLIRT